MKRRWLAWAVTLAFPFAVIGSIQLFSRNITQRNREWPTQMEYSPAFKSQSPNSVFANGMTEQEPVAGTVPRGFHPFHYGPGPAEAERAGRELTDPFAASEQNLARGKQVFDIFCAVCHGPSGEADGPIIPKYPNPPSFRTAKSKSLPDGTLFHVITLGRNKMPSYASQVGADDRWKAILYIRRLQGMGR